MRRRSHVLEQEIAAKQAAMLAFTGEDKKPAKKRGTRDAAGMRRATDEARERLESGEWEDADPKHAVGLYALLHEKVYGVAPDELADDWRAAVSAAGRLERELGSVSKIVAFLRFVWSREAQAEEKVKGTGAVRRRVTWRLQFAARHLLVDFKRAIVATTGKR